MKTIAIVLQLSIAILTLGATDLGAQTPKAAELVNRSIERHDPHGRWQEGVYRMRFLETRPDGDDETTEVVIDNRQSRFEIATTRDGAAIDGRLTDDDCNWRLNGSADYSDAEQEQFRLTCDRLRRIRNYYVYLWGLPMKLEDPGTILDSTVSETEFMGRSVLAVRVTYDEAVGSDIWYFYFDPADAALVGYRFYHDEDAGDGEYIVLKDSVDAHGLSLPAERTWYTNNDDQLLGTDRLVELVSLP